MLSALRTNSEGSARPPSTTAGRARMLRLGAAVAIAASGCLGLLAGAAPAASSQNPIQIENARPGTKGWLRPQPSSAVIAGYSLATSVAPGDTLRLAVSAAAGTRYRVEVYRLGWYKGIGARRVACSPSCTGSKTGIAQQNVPPDWAHGGIVQENWQVTDTVPVARSWTSGYYLAELVVTAGSAAGQAAQIPFVVRAPAGGTSAIVVVAPVDTWQAYNDYGGANFYTGSGTQKASRISFDRPYAPHWSQSPLYYDYPLIRFLERSGYDVTYTTDVDVDADPATLLPHRLVVVPGHSEYWSGQLRNALQDARDSGVNLAFLGGNDGYREVDYEDNGRIMVKRDFYRASSLPECAIVGVEWQGGWVGDKVETSKPTAGDWYGQTYSVNAASLGDPWFKGTGFTATSTLPGLVGYEWDSVEPNCVPGIQVLFHYQGSLWPLNSRPLGWISTDADAIRYRAASGATVFAAGSIEFSWGLDGFDRRFGADNVKPDPRLQRFMRNAFDDLTAPRSPLPQAH